MTAGSDTTPLIGGLPGDAMVRAGLADLGSGRPLTAEALLLLIARTRLRSAGLPVPEPAEAVAADPEGALYRVLAERDPASAYGTYNSLKRRLDSFIRCLEARSRLAARSEPHRGKEASSA
jgi:hypothetical protein